MIKAMHEKGFTYEEIGELFGISRQAAHYATTIHDGFRPSAVRRVIFVGLRNWMLENRVTINELSRRLGVTKLHNSLLGKNELKKSSIDGILKETGMAYEECFGEVEEHDKD